MLLRTLFMRLISVLPALGGTTYPLARWGSRAPPDPSTALRIQRTTLPLIPYPTHTYLYTLLHPDPTPGRVPGSERTAGPSPALPEREGGGRRGREGGRQRAPFSCPPLAPSRHDPGVTLPPLTAPPLVWALWYLEQGLWPLPIRDALDLAEWRDRLAAEKTEELGEEAALAWATQKAARGRKHTFVSWRKMRTPPTPSQVRRWWADRPERGIALLCGPGRRIAVVDVDTAKGGDPTPWESCAAVAETPSGGVHYVYREEAIRSTTSEVAPNVDTRGVGGLIAAPAGAATPGRRWVRWPGVEGLEPFPADLAETLALGREKPSAAAATLPGGDPLGDDLDALTVTPSREDRSFAAAVSEPALDGERHRKAAAIVGLLARRRPLPRDAQTQALALLESWATAKGVSLEVYRALERAWRGALGAEIRGADFALEVLSIWNEVRGSPPWHRSKVEETATGLWRTAASREEERATPPAEDDTDAVLDRLIPTRATTYTRAHFARDRRRGLLPIDTLPPWANYTGELDLTVPTGHGWGEVLNTALGGGLSPQYFCVLGAEQAKGGKTALAEQLLFGLALRTAAVVAGHASGPRVVPYYVGEMWQGSEDDELTPSRQLAHRDLARWLGVDGNLLRRGDETGGDAPGIRRLAEQLARDPGQLAIEILEVANTAIEAGPFYRARQFSHLFNVRALLSSHDQQETKGPPVDHRRGVPLLRSIVAAILQDRKRKAVAWKCDEREIWPLLFIDPIQRFQASGDNAVSALDEFVEELRAVCDEHGFIVLATSDTNKDSAKGGVPKDATPFARAAWVFRGSYKLLHLPDSALVLSVEWPKDDKGTPKGRVWVGLNRWGAPRFEPAYFDFVAEAGRYVPTAAPVEPDLDDLEDEDEPLRPRNKGRFAKS